MTDDTLNRVRTCVAAGCREPAHPVPPPNPDEEWWDGSRWQPGPDPLDVILFGFCLRHRGALVRFWAWLDGINDETADFDVERARLSP